MRAEPGNLSDFGPDAEKAWARRLGDLFEKSESAHALPVPDERTRIPDTVDWGGFPVRIDRCLQNRAKALRLLDWRSSEGDLGRALFHEEYMEWRVVPGEDAGQVQRVEMTTELAAYWETLAAHHPAQVLELVRRFAGMTTVDVSRIYGGVNPFAPGIGPPERLAGFREAMLPARGRSPWSPYNSGELAICFMAQGNNTLEALVALVLASAFPYVAADNGQPLSGSEAIAATPQAAVDCRNSDPTIVGKVVELSANGHFIALDEPIGIYILGVDHTRLLTPDGPHVPLDWFTFSRGSRRHHGQGLERSQRLVFEVPPGLGFGINDLLDSASEQPITFGGQIADLVRLGVHVLVSDADAVNAEKRRVQRPSVPACEEDPDCATVGGWFEKFEETENLLEAVSEPTLVRANLSV